MYRISPIVNYNGWEPGDENSMYFENYFLNIKRAGSISTTHNTVGFEFIRNLFKCCVNFMCGVG